jgi:hypothetical protein
MARRFGFVGRIGRALKNIVAPSPAPAPPRQPPPREAPEPPSAPRRDEYREIWRDNKTGRAGNYRKNLKVFHSVIDRIEADPEERLLLWESYVQNMVNPRGRKRRQDPSNMFWRDSGLDPDNFNWEAWRQAMGYTGKRRSRTP